MAGYRDRNQSRDLAQEPNRVADAEEAPPQDHAEPLREQEHAKAVEPAAAVSVPTETVEVFCRTQRQYGPLFRTTVQLEDKGKTVKRTRDEWQVMYNAWLTQPR